jgi:hypothetical protein
MRSAQRAAEPWIDLEDLHPPVVGDLVVDHAGPAIVQRRQHASNCFSTSTGVVTIRRSLPLQFRARSMTGA